MREVWPQPSENLDIASRLAGDDRPSRPDRPWVTLVMITSLDGAIAIDGVSGGLGSPADHKRFVAARRLSDGIVVGAGTAIAEDYGPAKVPVGVLSRSLDLDRRARLFSDPDRPPLLFTTSEAACTRGRAFDGIAEVIDLGDSVTPVGVLSVLKNRGMHQVVLEGGPTINGQFLGDDLVDEILLSISPLIVGGQTPGLGTAPSLDGAHRFMLDRLSMEDDLLFLRYLRRR